MKVLHAIASVNPADGGTVEMVRTLMTADGGTSEVATLDPPEAAHIQNYPHWNRLHPLGSGKGRQGSSVRFLQWLRANAERFDAIFVHGLWQYVGHGTWRAHGRTPYFIFPHGMLDVSHRKAWPMKHVKKQAYWMMVERHVVSNAAAMLFTAEAERMGAQGTFFPYKAKEVVVGGGVLSPPAANARRRARFYSEYPHLRGRRLWLYLGRLHAKKGCDLLLDAFVDYRRQGGQAHLFIAGEGEHEYVEALHRRVPADFSGAMTWAGGLYDDAKWDALHMAECFLLPSHQENFCVAAVEAMACAKPVLLSEKVNIIRDVLHDRAGMSASDTAQGASSLIANWEALGPDERAAMGERALLAYRRRYDAEAFVRRLYDQVEKARS